MKVVGFRALVESLCGVSDLNTDVKAVPHGAAHLLDLMRRCGVPVPLSTPPLSAVERDTAVAYGSHLHEIGDFLCKVFG